MASVSLNPWFAEISYGLDSCAAFGGPVGEGLQSDLCKRLRKCRMLAWRRSAPSARLKQLSEAGAGP